MRGLRRTHIRSLLTVLLVTAARHVALAQGVAGDSQESAVGPTIFGVPVAAGLGWLAWRKREGLLKGGKSLLARLGSLVSARFRAPAKASTAMASNAASAHQLGNEEIGATVVVRRQALGTIICVSGVLLGQRWDVPIQGLSIGRDPDSDVVVDHIRISGQHAQIVPKHGRVVVIDQKSTNGVFLNGSSERLADEAVLDRGDMVRLAEPDLAEFIYYRA